MRLIFGLSLLLLHFPLMVLAQQGQAISCGGYWTDCDKLESVVFPKSLLGIGEVVYRPCDLRPPLKWEDWRNRGQWRVTEKVDFSINTTDGESKVTGYKVRPIGKASWDDRSRWKWRGPGSKNTRPLRCEDVELKMWIEFNE